MKKILLIAMWFPLIVSMCSCGNPRNIYNDTNESIYNDTNESIGCNWREYGEMTCSDDYIFYVNNSGRIVRTAKGQEETKVIVDDTKCFELNAYNKKLYFISEADNYIYCCDFEGNNLKRIIDVKTVMYCIYQNNIYFFDGYYVFQSEPSFDVLRSGAFNLYKANLEGENIRQITECNTFNIHFCNDKLLYFNNDENAIYETDINGKNHKKILSGEEYAKFIVWNNCIYSSFVDYTEKSGIYCYNLSTGENKQIISTVTEAFSIWKDKLVYIADSNSSDAVAYISELDGSEAKELFKDCMGYELIIFDDWVYFANVDEILGVNLENYEKRYFSL